MRVSKNTVREYLRRARAHDERLDVVLAPDDEALRPIIYPDGGRGRGDFPDGYSQTQFYHHLARAGERRDLTLPLRHQPGRTLQLDYAGDKRQWVDAVTGEVHGVQVSVATWPHSAATFAIALPSQSTADFAYGRGRALTHFGGLPQAIVPDNLKAFVIKANRYEPTFNDVMVQLANHYQVDLQATRVRKPKDKAAVEGAVRVVYGHVYAPLRDRVFHSLAALNAAIAEQLAVLPLHKRPGCRRQVFDDYERPHLRVLPSQPFEPRVTARATVQRNYHVEPGPDHNFYSVPYQYVGQRATVVHCRSTVEVFIGPDRVATHAERHPADRYQYTTEATHLPRTHAEYLAAEGHDAAYLRARAAKIGPAAVRAIGVILSGKRFEAQAYRSCQGVLSLAKKYGDDRLEAAARRCRTAGHASYGMLDNILRKNLDGVDEQLGLFAPPQHHNIRGPAAYQ